MKRNAIKTVLFCLWGLMGSPLFAQIALPPITEEAAEFARIKTAYQQVGAVSCPITYQLFAANGTTAADVLTGHLTLSGDDYYLKIAHFEYLKQGNRLLYIDHQEQEMRLFVGAAVNSKAVPPNAGQFADLLDREGMTTYLDKLDEKRRKITLNSVKAGIQNLELWYTSDTYFINRCRMRLPEHNAFIDIQYQTFNKEKKGFGHALSTFLTVKNKRPTPTDKFKHYNFNVMGL